MTALASWCIDDDWISDFAMLTDESIDLRRNLAEVVRLQFIRHHDLQRVGGDNLCLDHAGLLTGSRSVHYAFR